MMTCVNSYRRACTTSIMMFYIVLQDSVETNVVISGSKGYEQFENTKGVIRSRKYKDTQYNTIQYNTMAKTKRLKDKQ